MSNFVQAFLASAATNVCNAEAEAVHDQSLEQFAQFTNSEYGFLVSLHGANDESIIASTDLDLLSVGYAACDEYGKATIAELDELSTVAYNNGDTAQTLSIYDAGGPGSLCPEFSDVVGVLVEGLG